MRGELHDGWLTLTDIGGWTSHAVRVRAEVIDGQPVVTSLHVDSVGTGDPALTSARVRGLPLRDMALLATRLGRMEQDLSVPRAMAAVARRKPPKHDDRAATTVEQVAEVWNLAREDRKPPRAEVMARLRVSQSTADRYIKRARQAGLIPASRTRSSTTKRKEQER